MLSRFCFTGSKKTKFSSCALTFATAAVAAALLTSVASATPIIGNPTFSTRVETDGLFDPIIRTSEAAGTITSGFDSATASGGSGLTGSTVSAHAQTGLGTTNSASAGVNWDFAVIGPATTLPVPLSATVHLLARVGVPGRIDSNTLGPGQVSASGSVDITFTAVTATGAFSNFGSSADASNFKRDIFESSINETLHFFLFPTPDDRVFANSGHARILSRTSISVGDVDPGNGSADVFGDPFIVIDPDWLLLHPGYSVIVSAGINNVAPAAPGVPGVPEPATLVLLGLGLAAMGLRRRRHQRKS